MMDILVDTAMDLQLNSLSVPFHLPVKENKKKKSILVQIIYNLHRVRNIINLETLSKRRQKKLSPVNFVSHLNALSNFTLKLFFFLNFRNLSAIFQIKYNQLRYF